MSNDAIIALNGQSTDPDVKRLVEAFGNNPEPQVITYEQVANAIGVDGVVYGSTRFRTVTNAWRKHMMRENNVDIAAERGEGLRILAPNERVSVSLKGVSGSVRKLVKTHNRMAVIPDQELDRVDAAKREHALKFTSMLSQQAVSGQKDLRKALKAKRDD